MITVTNKPTENTAALTKHRQYKPVEAQLLFHYLCEAYRRSQFSFRQYNEALRTLRFYDSARDIWTIGAGSGKWYRYSGRGWETGKPTGELTTIIQSAWQDYVKRMTGEIKCTRCGAISNGKSRFCRGCGASLSAGTDSETAYCRNCGRQIRKGAGFCNFCGQARKQ